MMIGQVGLAPVIGILIGLALGGALSVGAGMVVPGVVPGDPVALSLAPAAIGLAGLAAILVPVRRVLRGNPVQALRDE
jgi:ABC-type antimicrobial peptide transport system permease subunit